MTIRRLFKGVSAGLLASAATLAGAEDAQHHDTSAAATPIEVLSHEHRVVERMADVLVAMADEAEARGRLDAEAGAAAVDFLKGFLDACHHAKEEKLLFPAMEQQGKEAALTEKLQKEHDEGRAHVKAMAKALKTPLSAASVHSFAERARAYASLLRKHIETEDEKLFPAADRLLSTDAQAKLAEGFERIEAEETGAGVHEKYLGIAEQLEARYGKAPHKHEPVHEH